MVADGIKVRFSADAVSYQLAVSPVASEESLETQTERRIDTHTPENQEKKIRHAIRQHQCLLHLH